MCFFFNFQSGPARIFCKLFTLSYFISCDIMKNFHIFIPIQFTSKTISTFFCVLCHSRIFKHTWRLRLIKISLIVKNILALKGIPTFVNRIHLVFTRNVTSNNCGHCSIHTISTGSNDIYCFTTMTSLGS